MRSTTTIDRRTMSTLQENQACESNKAAWDSLYAATPEYVWGNRPLPFLAEIETIVRKHVKSGACILDAATGEGRNIPYLLKLSPHVTVCDASSHALDKLPAEFRQQTNVHQCDLAQTPFNDSQFDLILLADVIETLPNANDVLEEMRRILAPGGCLIGNIPDESDGIAGEAMTPIGENTFLYKEHYFYRFYDPSEAIGMLKQHGFSILHAQEYTWVENSHPAFRDHAHEHRSLVFVAKAD